MMVMRRREKKKSGPQVGFVVMTAAAAGAPQIRLEELTLVGIVYGCVSEQGTGLLIA